MKRKILIITLLILTIIIIITILKLRKNNIESNTQIIENVAKEDNNETTQINDEYIETIPENAEKFINRLEENEIILNKEEIEKYNEEIKQKADNMYDLTKITSLSKEEIQKYINSYTLPKLPQYNGEEILNTENTKNILNNRNLENIKDLEQIPKGIIVKRANLRSFPIDTVFYNQKNIEDFDNIQESELCVNTPVLIIHTSSDDKWNFVISPIYAGWVKEENIALATNEDYETFINNNKFGIVTEPNIEIEDTSLDMGVKLPYINVTEKGYQFLLPQKSENGYIKAKTITLDRNKAHIGYLDYTNKNVYIQAIKYEDVNYSWGGKNTGVDCSSYILNIYKCFGFEFPRNTSSQNKSVGQIINLENKTIKEKFEIIKNKFPCLLYQNGHVMLYLGNIDNEHYIIHASGDKMKVVIEELTENSNHIKLINKAVYINN